MSINAVGFASNPVAATPQLGALPVDQRMSPADEAKARAEAAAARQKADLAEIREKGLYQYAQEQRFKALKEKIEKDLLLERGIDDKALAGMTPEEQKAVMSSLEQEISKRIQEAMKEALQGESKAAAAEGRPPKPMIIDISV